MGSNSDFFSNPGCTISGCKLSVESSCSRNHGLIVTDSGSVFVRNWGTWIVPKVNCIFSIKCSSKEHSNVFAIADNNNLVTRYYDSPDFGDYCSDPCHFRAVSLVSTLFTVNQYSGTKNINSQTIKFSSLFSLPGTPCTDFTGWKCSVVDSTTLYTD